MSNQFLLEIAYVIDSENGGNDTGSKTQWFQLTKQRQMCYVHPVQQCEDWL